MPLNWQFTVGAKDYGTLVSQEPITQLKVGTEIRGLEGLGTRFHVSGDRVAILFALAVVSHLPARG